MTPVHDPNRDGDLVPGQIGWALYILIPLSVGGALVALATWPRRR
jgi:hypothetical protein